MTRHLWDKGMSRTLGLAIIAGLAVALTGAGTGRADTAITSCPYTINTPGTYALAADLTCSENGINIAVSNVTLKLNGYTITGPNNGGGTGVNICARTPPIGACSLTTRISNIQVQGPGLLQKFANGIYLQTVDNSQIQNVVSAFNHYGMLSSNSTTLQFNANVATENYLDGINLSGDSNDQVQQNTASGNSTVTVFSSYTAGYSGIALVGGSGHQVQNNRVEANLCNGIYINSTNSQIQNNTAFGNGGLNLSVYACPGIYAVTGASGNNIQNNTAMGNGIDLYDANTDCDSNTWQNDKFFTNNQACIK